MPQYTIAIVPATPMMAKMIGIPIITKYLHGSDSSSNHGPLVLSAEKMKRIHIKPRSSFTSLPYCKDPFYICQPVTKLS